MGKNKQPEDEQEQPEELSEESPEDSNEDSQEESKEVSDTQKVGELTNDLMRVQADFENFKKRCDKETIAFREYAKADLIKKLLTILDSFEIALKNTDNHDDFVKGMELVYTQLYSLLKDEGLQRIQTKDAKFDPHLHEVLLTDNGDDGRILEELQRGYKLKGAVLRHSKVKIGKQ